MKERIVITIGVLLVSILAWGIKEQDQALVEKEMPNDIRNATVLIEMQLPNLNQSLDDNLFLGYGIGTLIQVNNQIFLVTHNHWRDILEDITIVRFYDADHNLIVTIIGKENRDLVLHVDAGTQMLQPPQALKRYTIQLGLMQVIPLLRRSSQLGDLPWMRQR